MAWIELVAWSTLLFCGASVMAWAVIHGSAYREWLQEHICVSKKDFMLLLLSASLPDLQRSFSKPRDGDSCVEKDRALHANVLRLTDQRRLWRVQLCFPLYMGLSVVIVLPQMVMLVSELVKPERSPEHLKDLVFGELIFLPPLMGICCSLCSLFPRHLNKYLTLLYVTTSLSMCGLRSREDFNVHFPFMMFCLLSVSFVLGSGRIIACLSCIAAAIQCFAVVFLLKPRTSDFGLTAMSFLPAALVRILMMNLGNGACAVLSSCFYFYEAKATLEAGTAQQGERTVKRVLAAICDSLVNLDSNLVISEPSPALAGLLFRTGPQALEGRDFLEIMPASEHERFRKHVEIATFHASGGGRSTGAETDQVVQNSAHCLTTSLLDAMGQEVKVSIFVASFWDFGGGLAHVVGVLENGDVSHFSRQRDLPPDVTSPLQLEQKLQNLQCPKACDVEIRSEASSSIGSGSRRGQHRVHAGGGDSIADLGGHLREKSGPSRRQDLATSRSVRIDASKPDFPILSCTRPFAAAFGRPELNESLLALIDEKDEFTKWVHQCVKHQLSDLAELKLLAPGPITVKVQMVKATPAPATYSARLSFVKMMSRSETELPAVITVEQVRPMIEVEGSVQPCYWEVGSTSSRGSF